MHVPGYACRYVYHTLRNSKHAVDTIDEADVVYVYDYCYTMWLLSDHHAREHWWLKLNYEAPSGTGRNLLSIYRQGLPCNACAAGPCRHCTDVSDAKISAPFTCSDQQREGVRCLSADAL